MRTFLFFVLYMVIAVGVIFLAAVIGAHGAWYFAWLVGTAMIVLISAAGGALLDAQEESAARQSPGRKRDTP